MTVINRHDVVFLESKVFRYFQKITMCQRGTKTNIAIVGVRPGANNLIVRDDGVTYQG